MKFVNNSEYVPILFEGRSCPEKSKQKTLFGKTPKNGQSSLSKNLFFWFLLTLNVFNSCNLIFSRLKINLFSFSRTSTPAFMGVYSQKWVLRCMGVGVANSGNITFWKLQAQLHEKKFEIKIIENILVWKEINFVFWLIFFATFFLVTITFM